MIRAIVAGPVAADNESHAPAAVGRRGAASAPALMVPLLMPLLMLLLSLALTGCAAELPRLAGAARESARSDPPPTLPRCDAPAPLTGEGGDPRVRRLVAAAVAEWQRWGSLDVERLPSGEACACLAPGRCEPIDDGCGREQQSSWCPIVNEYWARTFVASGRWFHHDCTRVGICEARWPATARPIATPAWSAAFISAVMDLAGLADDEFLKTPYHADYVRAALDGRTSAYLVVPVPAQVAIGDLICAARIALQPRSAGPYAFGPMVEAGLPWFGAGAVMPASAQGRVAAIMDTRRARRPTPMHCDLVVQVDLATGGAGEAVAIGGNVAQSVARVRYRLDARGRVVADGRRLDEPLLVMRWRGPTGRDGR